MLIHEFSKPITAASLNESLAKKFGTKINIDKFTLEQLEDVRNKLRTQLSQVETNESYSNVVKSNTYQKTKMFLDVVNAAIDEKAAKPDYIDIDGDGDKKEPMKKAAKEKGDSKDSDSKGLSAKQKKLPAGLQKAIAGKKKTNEGAEEEATLVMAAKDMVDRITGWMEDTAEMQTESMLELADKIRDELGVDMSDQFTGEVKPALETLYTALESTRGSLTAGVAILTGEGAPETMGDEVPADDDMDMEPTVDADAETDAPEDLEGDEFATSDAAVGGDEPADREKRESIELSRKLGLLLADSKKKA